MSYGIDLGNSAVKVVALHRGLRGFVVTGASRRRVPKIGKPEDRKPTLMKMLYESLGGPNGRRPGVLGLSGRDINLQIVQQPNMKALNYRIMMGYELEQRRGGNNDLYADFCTLREPDAYFPQYLAMVGVGRSAYVDERIEIAARAGIDVRDAVPNAFALYAAYKNAYGNEGGTIMVLDLGAENLDMCLVRGGRLIYARNISTGSKLFDTNIGGMANTTPEEGEWLKIRYGSMLPPADNADPKEEEIRPALRTGAGQLAGFIEAGIKHARIEFGDRELVVDKIYLSGGGARLRGLPEYLQSAVKIPVELFDPFRNLDTAAVEKLGVEDFRALPTDMAVAIGLAELALMPTEKSTLSILPDPIKKRRNFFRTWLYVGAGAAAIVLALIVLTVLAIARRGTAQSKLEAFQKVSQEQMKRVSDFQAVELQQRETMGKIDALALPTLAPKAIVDVVSEIRQYEGGGIEIWELSIVDPNPDRRTDQGRAKRCLFRHGELGLVVGEVEEQTEETIKVRIDYPARQPEPRVFPKGDCVDLDLWDAEVRVVVVVGEVSAEVTGKANQVLEEIKARLTKEQRGQIASIKEITTAERRNWRRFRLAVVCQVRYE